MDSFLFNNTGNESSFGNFIVKSSQMGQRAKIAPGGGGGGAGDEESGEKKK